MEFPRALMAVVALFCIAMASTPQAVAQACGSSITLSANQWRMVGIPCVPAAANSTVSGVFGPSLGAANYGVTWIVWKRVYDDSQCVVSSGPADCYIKQTLTSPATTGDAFWIFSTVVKTLQFPSSSTTTPGPSIEFPVKLSTDGNSRYYMFANPYSTTVSWPNMVFPTLVFGFFRVNYTTQQAVNNSIVSKNVFYWNGNTYYTCDLSSTCPVRPATIPPTTAPAFFIPKEAAWLEMLQPNAVFSDVRVRVSQP